MKNIAKFFKFGYNKNMLNLVVTPREHNRIAEKHTKKIVRYLKSQQVEYSVYFSQGFEDLRNNVKQLVASGEKNLVIVGDDVTIHETVASVKDLNKVRIGIVPIGKKDDFAHYLQINPNPIQAIKDVLGNHVEAIDLLVINGQPVVNNLVIGASVEVFHQLSQFKIKNFFASQYATRKFGYSFSGIELSLDSKTKNKTETVFELVVANGGFSKGKPVSPLANVQDGLFNLTYSLVSNKHGKKKFIKQTQKGEHIYAEETHQYWMSSLKISSPERKIKAMIDGKIQNEEELNISVLENGLKIFRKSN